MTEKVAIVGGGISGLSAAYFALQKGYSIELFESSDRLGGLASSFDFNGLIIENYYHFICGGDHKLIELAKLLGIDNKIRFRPTKTAFYYNGRYYPFGTPLDLLRFSAISPISRLKFGLNIVISKYKSKWGDLDNITAKEWLCKYIGDKAYDVIWHPLLKTKFGNQYDKISAAWIWHRIHRVASSRRGIFSKEEMGYFNGGTQTLITEMGKKVRELGGQIHLESEINKIEIKSNKYDLILNSTIKNDFDKVIIAVPLPIASRILKGINQDYSQSLSSIKYIGVVCGIFRLREKVTDAFWLNINDPRIASNGFIEYTNLNSLKEISPDKIIYVPFYIPLEDELFKKNEDSLRKELFSMIKYVNPKISEDSIVEFRAFKSPYAQAICSIGFKKNIPSIKTPIKNIFLLDSTQLYPSDRALSALIELAEKMIREIF